jgi:hypothetical protein
VRGVNIDAANKIVDSLKSMLSVESSSTAKKGASALWRATGGGGGGLCEEVGKIFLAGDKEDAELALINTIT